MKKQLLNKRNIERLRNKINTIDYKIIKLLEKRIKIAKEILKIKDELKLPLTDVKRENLIIETLKNKTNDLLLKDFIPQIYEIIFKISKSKFILENKKVAISFKKIGIIGTGLIGGSILKGLANNKQLKFYGISKYDKDAKLAYEAGYFDKLLPLNELISICDLIIISTPINTITQIAHKIYKICKEIKNKNLLVIDTGSVKLQIVKRFQQLTNDQIEFIGTHPMAGSEKQGFINSRSDLFLNYPWIITPHNKNKKSSINKIKQLTISLGSKPFIMDPKKHDIIVAKISHLIFLLSKLIFIYVYTTNKKWLKYAGTGFKTTTRLAGANPTLHFQIFENNFKNICREYMKFLKFLSNFDIKIMQNFKELNKIYKLYHKLIK